MSNELLLTQNTVADTSTISLGLSREAVIAALGEPRATLEQNEYVILRYQSDTPTFAHYLFFQNNELVFKKIGREKQPKTLTEYISQLGQPEVSIKRYEPPVQDSLQLVIHVWSQKGVAITTEGINPQSPVYELQQFNATTLTEYLETWGQEFAAHKRLTVQAPFILQQENVNEPVAVVNEHVAPDYSMILFVVAFGVVILVTVLKLVLLLLRKLRKADVTT